MTDWKLMSLAEQQRSIYDVVKILQPKARVTTIWIVLTKTRDENLTVEWVFSALQRLSDDGYLRPVKDPHAIRDNRNAILWYVTNKLRSDAPKTLRNRLCHLLGCHLPS